MGTPPSMSLSRPRGEISFLLALFSKGQLVQWYHTRSACGRPWAQSPDCPCMLLFLQGNLSVVVWLDLCLPPTSINVCLWKTLVCNNTLYSCCTDDEWLTRMGEHVPGNWSASWYLDVGLHWWCPTPAAILENAVSLRPTQQTGASFQGQSPERWHFGTYFNKFFSHVITNLPSGCNATQFDVVAVIWCA